MSKYVYKCDECDHQWIAEEDPEGPDCPECPSGVGMKILNEDLMDCQLREQLGNE